VTSTYDFMAGTQALVALGDDGNNFICYQLAANGSQGASQWTLFRK